MPERRKVILTAAVSDNATMMLKIVGRMRSMANNETIEANMFEDDCYNIIVGCEGDQGAAASISAKAVHGSYMAVQCDEQGTANKKPFPKLEAKVPDGELAGFAVDRISVTKKS